MEDIDANITKPNQDSDQDSPLNEDEINDLQDNDDQNHDEEVKKLYDTADNCRPKQIPGGNRSPPTEPSDDQPAEIPYLIGSFPEKTLLLMTPPQDIHICINCKGILREPVQIEACEHYVCYQCYENIKSTPSRRCPEDHMEIEDKIPPIDKVLREEIENLEVMCQNHKQGCDWDGTVLEFPDHVELCEFVDMLCEYDCGTTTLKRLYRKHLNKECPKYLIKCPYCKDIIIREEKRQHFVDCKMLPLPCPNKCEKKTVPRSKLDMHLKTECLRSMTVCAFQDIGCTHESKKEHMPKHMTLDIADHIKKLLGVDLKHKELLNDIMKRLEENEKAMHERDIPRICELEKSSRFQLIWRIDDLKSKMEQAKAGNGETLFYPPFNTSKHGYRLSASLCLNGDGQAKGTHISVYISVLKGPYDCLLNWPMECRVTFTLLDQNPVPTQREHIQFSIKPVPCKENEPFLGRPKMEKNASFGCTKFASHEEIESRHYTDEDTMFLKISFDWEKEIEIQP